MGVRVKSEITIPESTGAVAFDGKPVTTEHPADATSTGAVEHVAPGTSTIALDGPVVVRVDNPEAVTTTVSWLSAKAVTPETESVETKPTKTDDPKVETK